MLSALLALTILPQQTYVGAGYSVEIPEDRLIVEEFTNDGAHVFTVLDPTERDAVVPPLRVLYAVEGRQVPYDPDAWSQSALEDARRFLEARGLDVRVGESSRYHFQGGQTLFRELRVTHADGSEWVCSFGARHLDDAAKAALYQWCHPADMEAQRSKDVFRALNTLKRLRWDPLKPLHFTGFGVRVGVPCGWTSQFATDETQAYASAKSETCEIEVRWFRVGDVARAAAAAEQLLRDLPAEIKKNGSPTLTGDYVAATERAMFGVGDRVVRGCKSRMYTGHPREGWRWDAVIPIDDLVLAVAVTARDEHDDEGLRRMQALLETLDSPQVHGRTVTTIRDGLILTHDTQVELVRGGPADRICYTLKRRGIDQDRVTGVHALQTNGEVFLEFRDDLTPDKRADYATAELREKIYEHRKVTWSDWSEGFFLGAPVRGVEARYYSEYRNEKVRDHVTVAFAEPWGEERYLVACYRGPKHTRPELETLLRHLMRGVTDARTLDVATYQDVGARYQVDPRQWVVEGGPEGLSSVATLRKTTLKTRWEPTGSGFLGGPPPLADALREDVEMTLLGWALEGEPGEAQYGDAALGEVPASFAALRRTDADGKEWDEIWMVADGADGRLWVRVTSEVSDSAAAESVSQVLASVRVRG